MSYSLTDDDAGTVEVTMPETGSEHQTTVIAWLKRPGERIEAEEAICLVACGDLSAEVTSPAAGVVRMLAVATGRLARIGAPLAVIDVGLRAGPEAARPDPPRERLPVPERLLRDAPATLPPPAERAGFLSPAVRRVARERAIDLREIQGSGRDGRLTLRDLSCGG